MPRLCKGSKLFLTLPLPKSVKRVTATAPGCRLLEKRPGQKGCEDTASAPSPQDTHQWFLLSLGVVADQHDPRQPTML